MILKLYKSWGCIMLGNLVMYWNFSLLLSRHQRQLHSTYALLLTFTSLKLGYPTLESQAVCSCCKTDFPCATVKRIWIWSESESEEATPCMCSDSYFMSFVVALSLKASLHQRCTTRWNDCRESCRDVNWSISARLKLADRVTYNLVLSCQNMRHVTCFNSQSARSDITCCLEAQSGAADRNTRSLEWPVTGWKVPVTVWIQNQ